MALVALAVCTSGPAAAAASGKGQLRLGFNEPVGRGGVFANLQNDGAARLAVSIASLEGGQVTRARSRLGGAANGAARMPRLDPSPDAARAVVRVRDTRGADNLDPGSERFVFGADFRLDDRSNDVSPGSVDNGDDLVQRGLYAAASQYKLQLDHRRATCRVSGAQGALSVTARQVIDSRTWYRVRCERAGSTLTLRLTRFSDDGSRTWRRSATGPTGSLRPESRRVPLSVGGKLGADGQVVESADQFNGRIDNVVLVVG